MRGHVPRPTLLTKELIIIWRGGAHITSAPRRPTHAQQVTAQVKNHLDATR
jgi:hypothetical protein